MTVKFNSGNPVIICNKCRIIIESYNPNADAVDYDSEHLCQDCKVPEHKEEK